MQIIETNLPTNGSFSRRNKTDEIILHHAEASHASVEEVNRWHLERGWTGIGYHFYIRKDGKVYRGRPEWAVGAHAQGHNSRAIGICCEGSYMTENMPQAQLDALRPYPYNDGEIPRCKAVTAQGRKQHGLSGNKVPVGRSAEVQHRNHGKEGGNQDDRQGICGT